MQLNWNIDRARGRLSFGKLLPMTGNRYRLCVSGREEGKTYQFLVMGENVEVALARSEHDASEDTYSIAFNTTELRKAFRQEWHEIRVFHVVANDGENTIAEGDLSIGWCPVWTDPESGEVYTMRGQPGLPGEPGQPGARGLSAYEVWLASGHTGTAEDFLAALKGPAATERYAYCEATGKYHRTYLSQNARGEYVWAVDDTPLSGQDLADASDVVFVFGVQTIAGKKIFSAGLEGDLKGSIDATGQGKSALVPTVEDNDDSQKAASTAWVRRRISTWWTAIKDTAVTWTKKHVFSAGLEGDLKGSIDATGQGKSALVPTVEDNDDSQKAASTKWTRGLVNSISRRASGYVHFNVFNSPTSEPNTNSVYTATISNLIPGETYKVYADFVALANSTNVAYNYYGSSLKFEFNPHDGEDADLTWQTSFRKFGVHVSDEKMLVRVDGTIYDADGKYAESVLGNKVVADENGEINVKFTRVPFAQQVYHFTLMNSMTITAELTEPDVVVAEEEENEAEGGEE